MLIAAQIAATLAALLHVVFFVFESVLWSRPAVYRRFGVKSQEHADTTAPMAYNQGFYNLALALGVLVGVVLLSLDGDRLLVGKTLVVFGTGCMAMAGLVLASTGSKYLRAAAIQFVPAALALILTVAA
jgi:putative membrane protein